MADPRYFAFTQQSEQEFVFQLTDPNRIQQALDILSGNEEKVVHVTGKIVKKKAPYNPSWDYHLDPSSIQFFDKGSEVCDANMNYVNNFLQEVAGPFLPGGVWCPWNSRLTREVKL